MLVVLYKVIYLVIILKTFHGKKVDAPTDIYISVLL